LRGRLGGERSRTEEREKELLFGDVLLERFGISLNMYCFFLLAWNSFVVGLVSITTLLKNRDGSQIGKREGLSNATCKIGLDSRCPNVLNLTHAADWTLAK